MEQSPLLLYIRCGLRLGADAVAVIALAALACENVDEVEVGYRNDSKHHPPSTLIHIVQTSYRSAKRGDDEYG